MNMTIISYDSIHIDYIVEMENQQSLANSTCIHLHTYSHTEFVSPVLIVEIGQYMTPSAKGVKGIIVKITQP